MKEASWTKGFTNHQTNPVHSEYHSEYLAVDIVGYSVLRIIFLWYAVLVILPWYIGLNGEYVSEAWNSSRDALSA